MLSAVFRLVCWQALRLLLRTPHPIAPERHVLLGLAVALAIVLLGSGKATLRIVEVSIQRCTKSQFAAVFESAHAIAVPQRPLAFVAERSPAHTLALEQSWRWRWRREH